MLDGFVARQTDTVSILGARLDTIADFVLVVVCLIKLLPVLRIPAWLYVWIGIIALIKVVNIISGFAVRKRFVAVHSVMNKATGALPVAADDPRCPAEILCDCCLCGSNVRRHSGRPFHQNRKRIEDHEIQRNPYRRKRLQESIDFLSGYVWIGVDPGS